MMMMERKEEERQREMKRQRKKRARGQQRGEISRSLARQDFDCLLSF